MMLYLKETSIYVHAGANTLRSDRKSTIGPACDCKNFALIAYAKSYSLNT